VLKSVSAQEFINFMVSPQARAAIDGFPVVNFGYDADPASMLLLSVLPGAVNNFDNWKPPPKAARSNRL
jgi:hypothetical protein